MERIEHIDYDDDITDLDCCMETTGLQRQLYRTFVGSSAVLSYLRLRPSSPTSLPCLQVVDSTTVVSTASAESTAEKRFTFTKVFTPESSQEEVFSTVAVGLIDSFICGKNVLLFAYGPTSSGKTYTMQGSFEHPGILPRTLERVFKLIGDRTPSDFVLKPAHHGGVTRLTQKEVEEVLKMKTALLKQHKQKEMGTFNTFVLADSSQDSSSDASRGTTPSYAHSQGGFFFIWLSFYEIYNENVFDLLQIKKKKMRTALKIGQDLQKQAYVKGLLEVPVTSAEEAYTLLCTARANLHTAETLLNACSSRSHCCFNIRLVQYTGEGEENCIVSTLTLCDLAGLERASKAGTAGNTLREAGRINSSLMVLSRCLETLRNNQNSVSDGVAPFRDSKLTQMMQPFFSNGGTVSMVVNVNPDMAMAEESLHALKFSAIACEVIPSFSETSSGLKESYSRLTELWQRSSRHWSSVGNVQCGRSESPEQEFGRDEVEQLFETIRILTEKCEKAEKEIDRQKAACADFLQHVQKQSVSFQQWKEVAERETERRVQNARQCTELELYAQAENGSYLDLRRQLGEVTGIIGRLQKECDKAMQNKGSGADSEYKRIAELVKTLARVTGGEDGQAKSVKDGYDQEEAEPQSPLASKDSLLVGESSTAESLGVELGKEELEARTASGTTEERNAQVQHFQNLLDEAYLKLRKEESIVLELQEAAKEKEEQIGQLQNEVEKYRKERAQKVEYLEREFSAAQLVHEKDVWALRSQLKMKEEMIRRLTEEMGKQREQCNDTDPTEAVHHGHSLTEAKKLQETVLHDTLHTVDSEVHDAGEPEIKEAGNDIAELVDKAGETGGDEVPPSDITLREDIPTPSGSCEGFRKLQVNLETDIQEANLGKGALQMALLSTDAEMEELHTMPQQHDEVAVTLQSSTKSEDTPGSTGDLEKLRTRCEDLLKELADVKGALEIVEQEKYVVEDTLVNKKEEVKVLCATIETERGDKEKLQRQLELAEALKDLLKQERDELKTKYDDLLMQQDALTSRLGAAQQESEALQAALGNSQESLTALRVELEERQAEYEISRENLQSTKGELDKMTNKYKELLSQQTTEAEKLKALQSCLNVLQDKLSSKEEEMGELRVELEEKLKRQEQLQKDLLSAEAKASVLLSSNTEQHAHCEKLQKELGDALKNCMDHETQHSRMNAQFTTAREDLQKTINALEASKQQVEKQLSDVEFQLQREQESAKQEIANAQKLLLSKNKELKKLQEELDLQMCRLIEVKDLLEAEKEARSAAEARVCSREEEVNRLKASIKQETELCSSSESPSRSLKNKSDESMAETKATRPAKRRQTLRKSRQVQSDTGDTDFGIPRRKTRSQMPPAVCEDKEYVCTATPAKRSVLVEQNISSASPLKRLGNYIVGILPGNFTGESEEEQISTSAKKRRGRKQLLSTDLDSCFDEDTREPKAPELTNRQVRMRTRRN